MKLKHSKTCKMFKVKFNYFYFLNLVFTRTITEQSEDSNYQTQINKKTRVKFANKVENKLYEGNIDDDSGVNIVNEISYFYDQNLEDFTNISFERATHKFLIDDDFYKIQKSLPKTIEEIKYFNEKKSSSSTEQNEKNTMKNQITTLCTNLLDSSRKESNFSIDGLLFNNIKKTLIVITDKFLYDYKHENNAFSEKTKIRINNIDYITLTRDNKYMILHLVEHAKQKNYTITSKGLHRVVGCLSSTFFYDKHDYEYQKEVRAVRKIPVILINSSFTDLLKKLEKTNKFGDYREAFNEFLDTKLKKTMNIN